MVAREKLTSLAELFSVELKFTVDTPKDWLSRIIKPKFFETDLAVKQKFKKDNPLEKNVVCCLCDFTLAVDAKKGWFDFVVRWEHLFLRNIYSYENLQKKKKKNDY